MNGNRNIAWVCTDSPKEAEAPLWPKLVKNARGNNNGFSWYRVSNSNFKENMILLLNGLWHCEALWSQRDCWPAPLRHHSITFKRSRPFRKGPNNYIKAKVSHSSSRRMILGTHKLNHSPWKDWVPHLQSHF